MSCTKCGSILLLGLEGKEQHFCPKCEGITIINKNISLPFIGKDISSSKEKIEEIFSKYNEKEVILDLSPKFLDG